jgi:hypothetical protein
MQKLKLLNFIFSHSIFAALCALALSYQTIDVLPGRQHNSYFYIFVFAATLCSYNFHLLAGAFFVNGKQPVKKVLTANADTLIFISLPAVAVAYTLLHQQYLLPYVAIAFAASFLYSLPLLPLPYFKKIRSLGVVKTLLLAITWTYVTAFLPLQKPGALFGTAELIFFAHRFCFMLQLCLIFDLRDVAVDKVKGLHSLATDISLQTANRLFYGLAAAFGVFTLLLFHFIPSVYLVLAFAMVQFAAVVLYTTPQQYRSYFFYFFLVDGLMILSALFTGLVSI